MATAAAVLVVVAQAGPASAAGASISIDPPPPLSAGAVTLTGKAGAGAAGVTSVVYVVDASDSTVRPNGLDCSGNGAVGPEDDYNGDNRTDVLDCEISGVIALNNSVAAAPGVQVGLVALAEHAAAADLDPQGSASFLPPGFTGGDSRPRVETVARSVVRHQIALYDPRDLGGTGTNYDEAIGTALSMLSSTPAGSKLIMFLSDGEGRISDAELAVLGQSGVGVRSFGLGAKACNTFASLNKMAKVSGGSCQVVTDPATLSTVVPASTPDAVNSVTVTIGSTSVAASLDAVGGWSANFTLGAGTYTATARAVLASGATVSASRSITVAASTGGPPPGTVQPGPNALKATMVKVNTPKPHRGVLPAKVSGKVGAFTNKFVATAKLKGARVVLQARPASGAVWNSVAKTTVAKSGAYALSWKPKKGLTRLRVVLQPYQEYATSAAAVPKAGISNCKVTKRPGGWSIRCDTTTKNGSRVRLLRNGKAVGFTRVHDKHFALRGTGKVGDYVIDITTGKRHLRLAL